MGEVQSVETPGFRRCQRQFALEVCHFCVHPLCLFFVLFLPVVPFVSRSTITWSLLLEELAESAAESSIRVFCVKDRLLSFLPYYGSVRYHLSGFGHFRHRHFVFEARFGLEHRCLNRDKSYFGRHVFCQQGFRVCCRPVNLRTRSLYSRYFLDDDRLGVLITLVVHLS